MIGRSLCQYQITERLGEGGMGVVWKGRDTALDRDVAVLPPNEFTRTLRRVRFTREANLRSDARYHRLLDSFANAGK